MNPTLFHPKTIAFAALVSSTPLVPTTGQGSYCDVTNATASTNTSYLSSYNVFVDDQKFKTAAKSPTNGKQTIGTSNSFTKESSFNSNTEPSIKRNKSTHDVYISGLDHPTYYYDNLALYWSDVEVELFIHADKFPINREIIRNQAFYTASRVAELNSENAVFELSSEHNLKFSLGFSEDRTLMINKPVFGVEGLPSNDIIFSFFIGDQLVSANTNDLDDFIDGFKEYLAS